MSEFMHTDLPEPVVPAISRCGFFQALAEVGYDGKFGAEVAAVGDDDALADGFLGVMVFDVACKVELGAGLFGQFNESGSTASEESDAVNGDVRVAGIG